MEAPPSPEHDLGSTEQCGFAGYRGHASTGIGHGQIAFTTRSAPLPSALDCHSAALRDL